MKKTLFLAAVFLLMAAGIKTTAQPNLQWIKNYGGLNTDKAYSVKQLPDNGYIVVGESNSNNGDVSGHHGPADSTDYWVARLDAAGNIVWQKTYGGSHNDAAVSVDLTDDGGFIIAGSSDSQDGDVTDHPNGFRTYDGGAGAEGGGANTGPYPQDPVTHTWIVKIDGAGNISWTKTLHFSLFGPIGDGAVHISGYPINYPGTVIKTNDGGYLVSLKRELIPGDANYTGFISMLGLGYPCVPYLVKLNSNGDIAWENNLYASTALLEGAIKSIAETADGYVFVNTQLIYGMAFITKVNLSGTFQSSQQIGGWGYNRTIAMAATADGGFIVTGTTDSPDEGLTDVTQYGGDDYWVLKLNSAFGTQWSKRYGGSSDEIPSAVAQTADGNFVIAGTSKSDDQQVTGHTASAAGQPANADIWVIKVNSNGDLIWSASYGGDKDDNGNDLVKTTDGGLLVAGSSFSSFGTITNKGEADWLLVKLNEGCNTASPAAPADQHFCSSSNPTVANLTATGQNIKWYDVPYGNSRPLALTTPLNAAGAYYATQTVGGCESARQKVRVRVFITPQKPVAFPQLFWCRNNPKVYNLRAIGTALKWYSSAASTVPLSPNTSLSSGIYYVTQTVAGLCESKRQAVLVVVVGRCDAGTGERRMITTGELHELKDSVVYPNPNKGTFKLFLTTEESTSKVSVSVTDIYGKTVLQKDCRAVNGTVQETINAANLPAGMYIVRYTNAGITKGIKIIIEK